MNCLAKNIKATVNKCAVGFNDIRKGNSEKALTIVLPSTVLLQK